MRALVTLIVVPLLSVALAAENSKSKRYVVDSLVLDATVASDGTMDVQEDLTYRFRGPFTFGYRDFPRDVAARLTQLTVSEDGRAFSSADGNQPGTFQMAKRGDSTRVTWYYRAKDEQRTFRLSYRLAGQVHRYSDVAELYFKFVGEDWDHAIRSVRVTVHLPMDSRESDLRVWAHGPLHGTVQRGDGVVHLDVAPLPAHTYWEGRILFPPRLVGGLVESEPLAKLDSILAEERNWAEQANAERAAREQRRIADAAAAEERKALALPFLGVSFLLAIGGLVFWRFGYARLGRPYPVNPHGAPGELPSDHPPALVAYLVSRRIGAPALVATLLDLAQRGYLSIRETDRVSHGVFGEIEFEHH